LQDFETLYIGGAEAGVVRQTFVRNDEVKSRFYATAAGT
jgi:hypothetical protein